MARKKTVTTTVEDDAEAGLTPVVLAEEQPTSVDEEALQRAVEELGADINTVRIVVYRVRPNNDPEECIDCPFDQFSKQQFREQYGPGHYLLQLRVKGLIRRKHALHFAAPLTKPESLPAPAIDLNGVMERMSLQIQTRFAELQSANSREMMELVKSLLARNVTPGADPIALGSAWLDQAVKLQTLMGRRGGEDELDRFAKLLEISRELGGGEGKGATGADVALELMRMTKPVLELAKVSAAADARQGGARAPSTQPKGDPAMMKNAMIRYGLSMLVKNAKADNEPLTYAEVLVDNLPRAQLEELLASDGWFERLCLIEPDAEPYREWFEELRSAISSLIEPEGAGDPLTDGAADSQSAGQLETAPDVSVKPAAARDTRAHPVRRGGNSRDARADAPPGARLQDSPGADRARPSSRPRAAAKGHR